MTGATGFLGSQITLQLLQRTQMQIIGTSKHMTAKEPKLREALSAYPLHRLKVLECDLVDDPECFARLVLDEKPQFVIHTACPALDPWGNPDKEI